MRAFNLLYLFCCFYFLNFVNYVDDELLIAFIFLVFIGIVCGLILLMWESNIVYNFVEELILFNKYNIFLLHYMYSLIVNISSVLFVKIKMSFFILMLMLIVNKFLEKKEYKKFVEIYNEAIFVEASEIFLNFYNKLRIMIVFCVCYLYFVFSYLFMFINASANSVKESSDKGNQGKGEQNDDKPYKDFCLCSCVMPVQMRITWDSYLVQ